LPDVKEEVEEGEEKEPATPTIKMESTSYRLPVPIIERQIYED
jgi:hypothetical protein